MGVLRSKTFKKKLLSRWSLSILLLGFIFGTFLPALGQQVQAAPQNANALDVVINEVAWAGTNASVYDEWIELYNPGSTPIDLTGWQLTDSGDISHTLNGTIVAGGYYLLERAEDAVSDISADELYSGDLSNNGSAETIRLLDNSSNLIDSANLAGNSDWPAGDITTKASMERIVVITDSLNAWASNNGITVNGKDANGDALRATPKQANSVIYQPLSIVINEVAWAGTVAYSGDEWIELYNPSPYPISLDGWRLASDSGDLDIFLSDTLANGDYLLLERGADGSATNQSGTPYVSGLLSDSGETIRLLAPDRTEIDTANGNGGAWPHGGLTPASSMERISTTAADDDQNWVTSVIQSATAKDAAGNFIYGTPGYENKVSSGSQTPTPTNTAIATATGINALTPTKTSTPLAFMSLVISEVGWGGTEADPKHEWIELYNPGLYPVDLDSGWKLVSSNRVINITLSGTIDASGTSDSYFLLERDTDDVIFNIPADQVYTGELADTGNYLQLLSPSGQVVDTANRTGGAWDAGVGDPDFYSMERIGLTTDSTVAWMTNVGTYQNGEDFLHNPINGTPRKPNWSRVVTPTPTPLPTRTPIPPTLTPTPYPFQSVVLNEVLPRPGHDWNFDGVVNVNDEFIEIINRGLSSVSLSGWALDDTKDASYSLPDVNLGAGERIAIYGYTSHISLSGGGATVRLLNSSGQITDVVTYTVVKVADRSWCRLPENGFWNTSCFPTPNEENAGEGDFPQATQDNVRASCFVPDTAPANILAIECGLLGMSIYDGGFWDKGTQPMYWVTGHSKYSTWFR